MANSQFIINTLKKICNDYRKAASSKKAPADIAKFEVVITTELGIYRGIPILIDDNRMNPLVLLSKNGQVEVIPLHNGEKDPVLLFNSEIIGDIDKHARESGMTLHQDMTPFPRGLFF